MSLLEKINSSTCTLRFKNDWLKIFTIDAPQHAVLSLLYDIESATEWVWKTREMRVLQELADDNEGRVVYQVVSAPWPVSDREIISRSTAYKDPETGEVFIKIESLPDFIPETSNCLEYPAAVRKFVPRGFQAAHRACRRNSVMACQHRGDRYAVSYAEQHARHGQA